MKTKKQASITNKLIIFILLLALILLPLFIVLVPFAFLFGVIWIINERTKPQKKRKSLIKQFENLNNYSVNEWANKK
jgi:hypothetical protein